MKTVQVGNGRFQMQQHKVCKKCQNYKMVTETKELDVEVEIGMQDGHEISCVLPPAHASSPRRARPVLLVGSGGIASRHRSPPAAMPSHTAAAPECPARPPPLH